MVGERAFFKSAKARGFAELELSKETAPIQQRLDDRDASQ
jgi:hypothetical protein